MSDEAEKPAESAEKSGEKKELFTPTATPSTPTAPPGMLTRDEVVAYYARQSGRSVEDWRFYEVFGLFRLAVIIQQIYRRYHLGQTTNPAFKHYWIAVHYLHLRCRRLMRG